MSVYIFGDEHSIKKWNDNEFITHYMVHVEGT